MILLEEGIRSVMGAGPLRKDEYLDGASGLIYCSLCHAPRQSRFVVKGRVYTPRSLCTCQKAEQDRREQERRRQEFRDRVQKNRSIGLPEPVLREYTFENDLGWNPEAMKKAKRYVDNWAQMYDRSIGLLVWGSVGTGKSFLAGCIANALLDQGVAVMMTNFSRILNTLTGLYSGDRNSYIDSLNAFPLLIIDDLGVQRSSEYTLEQVFNVIDGRYRSQLPFIVTTNLAPSALKNPEDLAYARIYDRILERCMPLRVDCQNVRQRNAAENMDVARKLLCREE